MGELSKTNFYLFFSRKVNSQMLPSENIESTPDGKFAI